MLAKLNLSVHLYVLHPLISSPHLLPSYWFAHGYGNDTPRPLPSTFPSHMTKLALKSPASVWIPFIQSFRSWDVILRGSALLVGRPARGTERAQCRPGARLASKGGGEGGGGRATLRGSTRWSSRTCRGAPIKFLSYRAKIPEATQKIAFNHLSQPYRPLGAERAAPARRYWMPHQIPPRLEELHTLYALS